MKVQKLLKYPEWQDLICEYVRQYGQVEGCLSVIPQKFSIDSIKRALNPESHLFIPEFAEKIQQAYEDYKTLHHHPSEDPNFRRDVFAQMKAMAKTGRSHTTDLERDENGRIIKKTFKQPGIDQWLYLAAYPPVKFTQETLLVVIPNLIEYIAKRDDLSEDIKILYQKITFEFKESAIEELQLRGLDTKYLK